MHRYIIRNISTRCTKSHRVRVNIPIFAGECIVKMPIILVISVGRGEITLYRDFREVIRMIVDDIIASGGSFATHALLFSENDESATCGGSVRMFSQIEAVH